MNELPEEHRGLVDEFKRITGEEHEEKLDKIVALLRLFDWDLNNAVSSYLDNQFKTVEDTQGSSSSYARGSGEESGLNYRGREDTSRGELRQYMNMQTQFMYEDFIPRLPRAPKISNKWQIDVGIYSSIESEKDLEIRRNSSSRSPVQTVWLLLLAIPRTLLQVVFSFFRYIFSFMSSRVTNRYPSSFEFKNYEKNYDFLSVFLGEQKETTEKEPGLTETSTLVESESGRKSGVSTSELSSTAQVHSSDNETVVASLLAGYELHSGQFNELHQESQVNYSWLLIVLVNDSTESQTFVRELFQNRHFGNLFDKSNGSIKENAVFINNIDKSPEAFEVGKSYRAHRLPFIALAGNVTNNPSTMLAMSVVFKTNVSCHYLENDHRENAIRSIIKTLHKVLDHYNPQLISQRLDKREIEVSRFLKEQQDQAYILSLEQDRLKKLLREREAALRNEEVKKLQQREHFLLGVLASSWPHSIVQSSQSGPRISIKLPDGSRSIQRFPSDLLLNDLYLYVETKLFTIDLINRSDIECSDDSSAIEHARAVVLSLQVEQISSSNYFETHPFNFELVQPFPKKVIAPGDHSIESVPELRSGAGLFVEYIYEDDSEGLSSEE